MKRERRMLLLMREYILGGAETQFRYLIEYAEQNEWKMDVIIEHDLQRNDMLSEKTAMEMKHVRFYDLHGDRFEVLPCIMKNMVHVKYSACLIYHPPDLVLALPVHMLGIRAVYSERVDASIIIGSPHYQRCLKFCSGILANSRYAKKELERLTGKKVLLIRNGKPVVSDVLPKEGHQIRRILVPARIAPPKNQMLPLHFLRNCQEFQGKIVFAGLVEDKAYYGKLKQFVRKNGLQEKVEFLGYVEDIREEYMKADSILLPSFAEGTPNVVLEAYMYGRPVMVSDINVERDIVTDSRLRFGVNNPVEIGKCIRYLQEMSDEEYNRLIEKNREYVLHNYNIEKMAKSFYVVLSY